MTATGSGNPPPPPPVVDILRCPVCGSSFTLAGRTLRCAKEHSFDLARQGYVNLLGSRTQAGTADTAEMVAARVGFLDAGHYAPLSAELARRARELVPAPDVVVDAGGGTGHHLARVLAELPGATGLALDVSAAALRRAAKAHPRLGAAVWNLWEPWPVATGSVSLVLNVFAPRNGAEFRRVLRRGGAALVATPGPSHLRELGELAGTLSVDERKEERLDAALSPHLRLDARDELAFGLTLSPEGVRRAVGMGPSAFHLDRGDRRARLDAVSEPVEATVSFTLSVFRVR